MRYLTCSRCGRPFEQEHSEQRQCLTCRPHTTDDRSLGAYQRARAEVLRGSPLCYWCGVNLATTADHLVPKAHGGTDAVSNLVPACGPCNFSRKDNRGLTTLHRTLPKAPPTHRPRLT